MAWLEHVRAAQIAGVSALMLLGVACSSDDKSNGDGNHGDGNGDDQGGLDEGSPEGETKDAGKMDASKPPTIDAKAETPAADAGDAGTALPKLPDGGSVKQTVPDAAVVSNALTPLPHDGTIGSICYGDGDCNGDDLHCQLPPGSAIPGFCVDDCDTDKDCHDLDNIKGRCAKPLLTSGLCQYPCGGPKNDGKGACPENMQCVNFAVGILALPDWQCRYPEGGGKKTEQPFAQCEAAHQGGDCKGLSWCAQPALSVSSAVFSHGYCSPICMRDQDCKGADEGTTAKASCIAGVCIFDCSNKGARCPLGMNCEDINMTEWLASQVCIYIE
jgi:hypothetical protein